MIDLNPHHLETVKRILAEHLPGREVRAFGSRATWTAWEYSDLDLAVVSAEPLAWDQRSRMREAFEESDLPIRVDVVDWKSLSDGFRQTIEGDCVVLQEAATSRNWPRVMLRDVVDLTLSSVDKKTKPNEIPVRLCNYMDAYRNQFIHERLDFMTATATEREISRCSLQTGDVLITKDSEKYDDIGVPALVTEDIPDLVCGYHLAILRPSSTELDGAYLFYALSAPQAQQQFHAYANGVTRFGLRKADIGLVEIPLPPRDEQQRIASILAALDDKIELNRRMCQTLEAMAQALFKSWFVDFDPVRAKADGEPTNLPPEIDPLFPDSFQDSELGEIPEGWQVGELEEVIEVNPLRSIERGQVAKHVAMAALPTSGAQVTAWAQRAFTSGSRFTRGDTLLARITPSLENGKTALVDFLDEGETGWGSTEFIVLRPKSPWPSEFGYLLARDQNFRAQAIVNMTGTSGRQRVPTEIVGNFTMMLPATPVIVAFGEIVKPWFALVSTVAEQARTLAIVRDVLVLKLLGA